MTGEQIKEQIMAFAPLVIAIVSLTNTYLSMRGMPCITIESETITQAVSAIATIVSVLWSWWRNNNVTENAQASQEVLNCLRAGIVNTREVFNFLSDKIDEMNEPADNSEVKEEVKEAVERSEELDNKH